MNEMRFSSSHIKSKTHFMLVCFVAVAQILVFSALTGAQTTQPAEKGGDHGKEGVANDAVAEATPPADARPAAANPGAGAAGLTTAVSKMDRARLVNLSFKDAKIDLVAKWLGEISGKTIIKHPKVQCQLNVMSSRQLTLSEAVRHVHRALALEGFAAIETRDAIYIVPESDAAKIAPEWVDGDEAPLEGKRRVVRRIPLKFASAAKVESKLKAVLSAAANVQIGEQANVIIVTDHADNVSLAEELAKTLDLPEVGDRVTDVFQLHNAVATELATVLSAVFAGGGGAAPKGSKPQPPGGDGKKPSSGPPAASGGTFSFIPDPVNNRLIATVPTRRLSDVRLLIEKLDTAKPADLAVRVLPMRFVEAIEIVEDLAPLYRSLRGTGLEQVREIAAHARSNSLIILSNEEEFAEIRTLVEKLDTEAAEDNTLKVFRLQSADAEEVSEQLLELYTGLNKGTNTWDFSWLQYRRRSSGDKTQFVADRRRNAVIVLAPPSEIDTIAKMVETLDEPVEGDELVPKIIPLRYVRAYDVEDVLNVLFLKKERRSRRWWDPEPEDQTDIGRLYGKVRITSLPETNSIIVASNSVENLNAIAAMVAEIDVQSPGGETSVTVPLRFARAATVANTINILFAQRGAPPMRQTPRQQQQAARQRQNAEDDDSMSRGFELEEETVEESYYPWLGSGREDPRQTSTGRLVSTGSELIGKVRVVPDNRTNALLISTNPHLFASVLKLVDSMDVPTAQVLIEAKIIEISVDDRERLGTRFSPDGARLFEDDDFDDSVIVNSGASYREVFSGTELPGALRTGLIEGAVDLDLLLQFLRKNTDTRVRAEPRINVADNQRGKLFIGSQIPFIEDSQLSPEGTRNDSFEYIDVGIILELTPHINNDDEVALRVRVEASQQRSGETLFGGAIIDTRNYRTDLSVKSGQTIVLGGILQREESEVERKVPILGDIPLLGWLFKKRDSMVRDVELMVFLRPTVTRSPEEVEALLRAEQERARGILEWDGEASEESEDESDESEESSEPESDTDGVETAVPPGETAVQIGPPPPYRR